MKRLAFHALREDGGSVRFSRDRIHVVDVRTTAESRRRDPVQVVVVVPDLEPIE